MNLNFFFIALLIALASASASFAAPIYGVPSGYRLTPAGYQHESCLFEVPSGSEITRLEDGLQMIHPDGSIRTAGKCMYETITAEDLRKYSKTLNGTSVSGSGWQQYAKWLGGDKLTAFTGAWTVTALPSSGSSQTLFTFPGLQNIDWVPPQPRPSQSFDIIQPVIQFGSSAAGDLGANTWSLASWYVTLGYGTVFTKLVPVNVNDTVFGNMTKVDTESWFISGVDDQNGQRAEFTVKKALLTTQPWAYVTLEVYGVDSCDQYPPTGQNVINFTKLSAIVNGQTTAPSWSVGTDGQTPPICSSSITINSSSSVDIAI